MAIVNGWGRGTWGEGAWGSPISVTLTAPSAATANVTAGDQHSYVVADANVTPTGQAGTSAVAGVGVNAQAVATLPSIVSSVGTPTVVAVADANVSPSGVSATGSTFDPTLGNIVEAKANVFPTGQSATSVVGGVGVNGKAVVALPTLVSSVGTPSVLTNADANVTIDASGDTFKGLTSVGTLSIDAEANVIPTGQTSTGAVGTLTFIGKANVTPTGVSATGAVGTASVDGEANVSVTGQASTSAVGGVGVNGKAVVALPTLVSSLGSVTVTVDAEANVTPTGQLGTSALGTPTLVLVNNISVSGFSTTSDVGSVSVVAKANAQPTGVSATGEVGIILVWSLIDESQTPNYTNVTDTQNSGFAQINETQSPSWKEVA